MFTRACGNVVGANIPGEERQACLEDDLEVPAVVHAPSCPPREQISLHCWEQRAGELEFPRQSLLPWLTLHPLCLGGLAVMGDGPASWGALV